MSLDRNKCSRVNWKKGGLALFKSIADFLTEWKLESGQTEMILNALTDASLSQEVAPGHRTLGRMAWHIADTIHEMMSAAGLRFEAPVGGAPPTSAADMTEAYRQTNASFQAALQEQWSDTSLTELRPMYGEQWTGATVLSVLLKHEIHHRAQMTVLMRQAGLRVPGVYGPAQDEWAAMGMEAPAV